MTHASQASLFGARAPLFLRAQAVEDSIDETTRTVRYVASTDSIDGHGTIVRQNWRLGRFQPRGAVLYAHDSDELPVGTATVAVEDGKLMADVTFSTKDLNPMAEQVWLNVRAGILRGISPGFIPHTITCEMYDDRNVMVLDDNELYELSITPCPSNEEAMAQMRSMHVRGAVPFKAYVTEDSSSWDGAAAEQRIRKWASSDGSGDADKMDWAKYRAGFAWYDSSKAEGFGSYKLAHHDVADGALVTNRAGVIAAGNAMSGSRGGVELPEGDVAGVKSHLEKHYHQFDMKAPWEQDAQKQIPPPPNDGPAVTEEPPILEQPPMAEVKTEPTNINTVSILRALDLPIGATEQDGIASAVRLRQLELQVQAITGASSSAEAVGALRAMKESADKYTAAQAELLSVKAERDAQNFEVLIAQGKTDHKLKPAQEQVAREEFTRAVAEGRGALQIESLRGWLKATPADIRMSRDVKQPSATSGAQRTFNGKLYKDMSHTQRAACKREDPELFRAMKEDFLASEGA